MHLFSEHIRKDHSLSKIDARVKLVFTLAILAMVLSYKGFFFPLMVLGGCIFLCVYIKVPLKVFLMRFSEPLFIAIVLILLKFFFTGKEALFTMDIAGIKITGYLDGLKDGLMIACRILGAVSIVVILGFTTPFAKLIAALSWLRVPKGLIEISIFAYRYIFTILEDAFVIYNAQKNRLGYLSIKQGLVSFGTLAGFLIIKAFDHSQNTTVAMVQRGYNGDIPMLKHKPFRVSEVIVSFLIIAAVGFVWQAQ